MERVTDIEDYYSFTPNNLQICDNCKKMVHVLVGLKVGFLHLCLDCSTMTDRSKAGFCLMLRITMKPNSGEFYAKNFYPTTMTDMDITHTMCSERELY
jgi:hypothetical protein